MECVLKSVFPNSYHTSQDVLNTLFNKTSCHIYMNIRFGVKHTFPFFSAILINIPNLTRLIHNSQRANTFFSYFFSFMPLRFQKACLYGQPVCFIP